MMRLKLMIINALLQYKKNMRLQHLYLTFIDKCAFKYAFIVYVTDTTESQKQMNGFIDKQRYEYLRLYMAHKKHKAVTCKP